jgi:hypothetical protein
MGQFAFGLQKAGLVAGFFGEFKQGVDFGEFVVQLFDGFGECADFAGFVDDNLCGLLVYPEAFDFGFQAEFGEALLQ